MLGSIDARVNRCQGQQSQYMLESIDTRVNRVELAAHLADTKLPNMNSLDTNIYRSAIIIFAIVTSHSSIDRAPSQATESGHLRRVQTCVCREPEGASPVPGDPWANTEFHIKWKRYAYIQCSWDTRATLSQLGGYKRVINYMKRWDDLQVRQGCPHVFRVMPAISAIL